MTRAPTLNKLLQDNLSKKNWIFSLNVKFEIRSTKSETSTKVQNPNEQNKNVSNFGIWAFEFVSNFEFRIFNQ